MARGSCLRETARDTPRIVWSLAWASGMAYRARAGRLGRDGALSSTSARTTGSPIAAAGSRGAPLNGRLLTMVSTASSASLLSLRPPPGPAPAASLRQCCLRLRHACRLAARVARGGPAWRAARRERSQQAMQGSLPHSGRRRRCAGDPHRSQITAGEGGVGITASQQSGRSRNHSNERILVHLTLLS